MIKPQSDDPDVAAAAAEAYGIINGVLAGLPKAETFDYGGHEMHLGEYDVCTRCTSAIAEAQAACRALLEKAEETTDETVKEHLEIAVELFRHEADLAVIRAELHNGEGSEKILNTALDFIYRRNIHDSYDHSHHHGS